jgi:hypothetical protein
MNAALLPLASARLAVLSGGMRPLDNLFTYTPAQAYSALAAYGPAGRAFDLGSELTLDLVYPLIYSLFFCLATLYFLQRAAPSRPALARLALIPFFSPGGRLPGERRPDRTLAQLSCSIGRGCRGHQSADQPQMGAAGPEPGALGRHCDWRAACSFPTRRPCATMRQDWYVPGSRPNRAYSLAPVGRDAAALRLTRWPAGSPITPRGDCIPAADAPPGRLYGTVIRHRISLCLNEWNRGPWPKC